MIKYLWYQLMLSGCFIVRHVGKSPLPSFQPISQCSILRDRTSVRHTPTTEHCGFLYRGPLLMINQFEWFLGPHIHKRFGVFFHSSLFYFKIHLPLRNQIEELERWMSVVLRELALFHSTHMMVHNHL